VPADEVVGRISSEREATALRALGIEETAAASPKSMTTAPRSGVSWMFCGFRSLWMIPAVWAASIAAATSIPIRRTSASGMGPSRLIRSARDSPVRNSMVRKVTPAASPRS